MRVGQTVIEPGDILTFDQFKDIYARSYHIIRMDKPNLIPFNSFNELIDSFIFNGHLSNEGHDMINSLVSLYSWHLSSQY